MSFFKKNTNEKTTRHPSLMPGQDAGYAFRRSRTLTGTTSNKVTASAEARSQLKTTRLQAHQLHGHKRRVLRLLGGSLALCAFLGLLLLNFIGQPTIATDRPSAAVVPEQAYRHSISEYFQKHPVQRFGVFLNESGLEVYLQSKHSEIKHITPDTGLANGNPVFSVVFRQPVLVWQAGAERFFVDDQGVAFSYDYHQGQYVAVTDQSGLDFQAGGAVASGRFIAFLGQLVGAVNKVEKGKVVSVVIPPAARQIDLRLEGREYTIKTHLDREPHAQAADIAAALAWFDGKAVKPQALDVRVAGRAFYK